MKRIGKFCWQGSEAKELKRGPEWGQRISMIQGGPRNLLGQD
jgi:hypothetical protein